MGLRLYQAPVESDVQSKPAAEKNPAHARSIIRRTRRNAEQIREMRRRQLADNGRASLFVSNNLFDEPPQQRLSPPPLAPPTDTPATTEPPAVGLRVTETGRAALRDMASRLGLLDDRVVAMFGERWAQLHAITSPPTNTTDPASGAPGATPGPTTRRPTPPTPPPGIRRGLDALPITLPPLPTLIPTHLTTLPSLPTALPAPEPFAMSNLRSTQAPNAMQRGSRRTPLDPPGARSRGASATPQRDDRRRELTPRDDPRRELEDLINRYQPSATSQQFRRRVAGLRSAEEGRPARFDGLGDRNRSLSPDTDMAWDTLLSTVTPDPQPPSVGSSFVGASFSASAAASQNAATGSASTSLTETDTPYESLLEQPECESGCEHSDTEDDDDDEIEQNPLTRFISGMRTSRRPYADVAHSTSTRNGNTNSNSQSFNSNDDSLEPLGGIDSTMQNIVRSLARREDIPDDWWAAAGLSRTIPREDSGN